MNNQLAAKVRQPAMRYIDGLVLHNCLSFMALHSEPQCSQAFTDIEQQANGKHGQTKGGGKQLYVPDGKDWSTLVDHSRILHFIITVLNRTTQFMCVPTIIAPHRIWEIFVMTSQW